MKTLQEEIAEAIPYRCSVAMNKNIRMNIAQAIIDRLEIDEEQIKELFKDKTIGMKETKFGDGFDFCVISGKFEEKTVDFIAEAISQHAKEVIIVKEG